MKEKITAEEKVKKRYRGYIIFRTTNLVYNLRRQLIDSGIKRWLFIVIPIIVYSLNLFLIMKDNAFWNDSLHLDYARDMSNSVALTILYFVSYYLSYYFPLLFDKWINVGISKTFKFEMVKYNEKKEKQDKMHRLKIFVETVFFLCIALGLGFVFLEIAAENENIWINSLGTFSKIYYCLYLGITWYQSLSVLAMALIAGNVIFWSLRTGVIEFKIDDYNYNLSIVYAVDVLLCTFSYGLIYIVGSFIFVFNDRRVASPNIDIHNAFSEDIPALILVAVILIIVAIAYVPLQELINFMRSTKTELLKKYNKQIE